MSWSFITLAALLALPATAQPTEVDGGGGWSDGGTVDAGAPASASASADTDPRQPRLVPTLSPQTRLAVLDAQLDLAWRDSAVWYFSWASAWSALAVSQVVQYPRNPYDRPAYWVWSISSVLSAGLTWLFRPQIVVVKPELLALRANASLTLEQRLRETERLWLSVYDDETIQRAWWQQMICVVTNLTPFLILGLGWREWNWGYLAFGVITSELQAFTFPQLLHRFGVEPRIIRSL